MSKKKNPPEKKQLEYEKDHYTLPRFSARGFRKTWKKKKNYRNRVVRRKSKHLLSEVADFSLSELTQAEDSFTSELLRKGLTKKKVYKTGVVNLREKIRRKKERREGAHGARLAHERRLFAHYRDGIIAFESDPLSKAAQMLRLSLRSGDSNLRTFLESNPEWKSRLRTKLIKLEKQQRLDVDRARLKSEQSWKWKSPALRRPKAIHDESVPD